MNPKEHDMKKILALIICLLFIPALFGCGSRSDVPADAGGDVVSIFTPVPSGSDTASPVPSQPSDTYEPSEPAVTAAPVLPTEAPFVPANVDEAIARYQGYAIGFTPVDRSPVPPSAPISEPRYTLGSDGIYHSSESTGDNEASIMFTGDLMCQTRQQEAAKKGSTYDFTGSFYYLRDLFSKCDLLVGNLEATLCASAPYMSERSYVDGSPHLNSPATFLEALRYAGYDMVVMANNHACDSGVRGIYDTLDRVEEYRLIHTGTFRNIEEPRIVVIDVEGIKVAILSYATYFNHKEERITLEGQRAMLNIYSKERVARDAASARAAGAEYVFCYIHWGVEYMQDPNYVFTLPAKLKLSDRSFSLIAKTNDQPTIAQEIADAGVDYILGSHPHAVQPYDILTASDGRRVPVIFSLGNFVSHQKPAITKDTMILRVVLTRDSSGKAVLSKEGYVPARELVSYNGRSYTVVPITYPYRKDNSSSEFAPAYYRIVGIVGPKLPIMGTL